MMSEHMGAQSSSALLEKWERTEAAAAAAAHELGDVLEPPATLNAAIAAGPPPFSPKP